MHQTLNDYLFPEETTPIDAFGGQSMIVDYKGRIVGRQDYGAGSTFVPGVIDVQALRDLRARAQWDNWLKDLRTELYQLRRKAPAWLCSRCSGQEPACLCPWQ